MSLSIQSKNGKVYEGELYAVDPVTKSVALKTDASYIILNPTEIAHITGDLTACKEPALAELGLSVTNIEKREASALRLAEKSIEAINSKVGPQVQALYDKISLIYPCIWEGTAIVVLGECIIADPYAQAKAKPGCDSSGMGVEMLQKILDGERRKLNL
ncbi:hypothetical protein B484DRAFT_455584 [Ochromonadaceae sp. CCMP2298]|nr:hypothetical protein B484DRAFT_455584 [Ochromonadaceae sp. CCMP2298]|eukprot:CAMPEP_0173185814 /NCGR_PEP_ID=MMETSP1141-20130122/9773_1 /TAXON_ID=483371 /ORGANISM="non described non described, Strain CCMP2298" /LENGTH=158 /DNA_ID=CAMNT_0014109403 /DNA_START=198 /DNA_END=674 /DNA_ORIENTATION=+